ncbi:DUF2390 domain-containing protein [Glaciecola petra]|uniref:DUF2390 domain-containing protein n=1 Tax=Glaciecola petra TaxID=3075602 RepID=A0ABU2ZRD5_9ALTE|nr:DUF2390 domain-containing protein [Aestuariibacter sp. P117]MDT0595182.1 DUF2390 domain-containing protein [Aestuariibacter sp. P117]
MVQNKALGNFNIQDFWRFSLRHYLCKEQVITSDAIKIPLYEEKHGENQTTINKDILLNLQDNYTYNVNLILAAIFSALQGKVLNYQELDLVKKSLAPLDSATQILRQKRRNISENQRFDCDIKENEEYKQALQKEIESEKEQQVFLMQKLQQIYQNTPQDRALPLNLSRPLNRASMEVSLLDSLCSIYTHSAAVNSQTSHQNKQGYNELLSVLIERVISHEQKYLMYAYLHKATQKNTNNDL